MLDVLPFQKYCNRLIASVLQEWKLLLPWIWALEPEQDRNRIHFQRTKIARKGDEEKTGRTSSDLQSYESGWASPIMEPSFSLHMYRPPAVTCNELILASTLASRLGSHALPPLCH